jgi:hypothetical protein
MRSASLARDTGPVRASAAAAAGHTVSSGASRPRASGFGVGPRKESNSSDDRTIPSTCIAWNIFNDSEGACQGTLRANHGGEQECTPVRLELPMGIEPMTSSLPRTCSTSEPRQHEPANRSSDRLKIKPAFVTSAKGFTIERWRPMTQLGSASVPSRAARSSSHLCSRRP